MSTATSSLPLNSDAAQTMHRSVPVGSSVGRAVALRRGGVVAAACSAATERLQMQVRTVAPHYRTALITGERGARKEEVARALHAASPVARGPFVVCDAGWMETLLRSGGKKDANSAEDRNTYRSLARAGRGGTIFFPELGLFSSTAQVEVLNLLLSVEKEPGHPIRVIASISGDLQAMVAGGTLRSELREKIGVIELAVAPLRERLSDFAAMVERILEQIAIDSEVEATTISGGALRELQRRGWPGNDRELESTLRLAALNSSGAAIEALHLPPAPGETEYVNRSEKLTVSAMKLQDVMDAHVQEVLRRCDGNKFRAAEVLGISRSTLYRMLDALHAACGIARTIDCGLRLTDAYKNGCAVPSGVVDCSGRGPCESFRRAGKWWNDNGQCGCGLG